MIGPVLPMSALWAVVGVVDEPSWVPATSRVVVLGS
jgi:hypothetical protein